MQPLFTSDPWAWLWVVQPCRGPGALTPGGPQPPNTHGPSLIASQVRVELPAFERPPTVGRRMTSQWDISAAVNPMRKLQVRNQFFTARERDHFTVMQVWVGASAASFPSHLPGVL